ncbi:MAG TPA: DUF4255 domain-containing protein [Actinoplanes sp.]|nr:DUF4255 domain-containing protein [Actinoplanes sp.]
MIDEVDTALRDLLTAEILAGLDIQVEFDAPTRDWSARRTAPTVNLFLYDIQEEMDLRHHGTMPEYDENGLLVAEHGPPRYFALSYLVTAWTSRAQDEHRILSVLLAGLVPHDAVPPERLTGSLARQAIPVRMSVATPPARDRGLADIWTSVGGNLRPSLDLVILAPLAVPEVGAGPLVTDGLRLQTATTADGAPLPAERRRRGDSRPIPGRTR